MAESPVDERHNLTPGQIHQLMTVIAGMDSVKEAGSEASPPPTDEEIQHFLDYVGMGVVNDQRVEYEEEKQNIPEPPRRNKQACQYFWRRHYLSIIQEDEEEHNDTPGSSRTTSRPGSTYENNISRLSRVMGALSPLACQEEKPEAICKEVRSSWGSEISMESMTSVNSILSEEGSVTSQASFVSDEAVSIENNKDKRERRALENLSSLLESVHPPSHTPDSMLSCESPSVRLSKADSETEEVGGGVLNPAKFKMGSKFKQSIQQIEDMKRKGKGDHSEVGVGLQSVGPTDLTSVPPLAPANDNVAPPLSPQSQVTGLASTEKYWHATHCLDWEPEDGPAGGEDQGAVQVHPHRQAEEAPGREEEVGGLERRDLTISTLIAECEEYVKTDQFTKDLSDHLVHLFKSCDHQKSISTSSSTESMRKPPRIPESLRTKISSSSKSDKSERNNIPKFPVNLRTSTYDNVAVCEAEGEDEGFDNDYSDDSSSGPGHFHEKSPATTSEGYDSAQESGEISGISLIIS